MYIAEHSKRKKNFYGTGIDISKNSLGISRLNAKKLLLEERVKFYKSDVDKFNLDKYDLAIKYLNDFSSNDQILSALALSTIGDSFIQLDQLDDGLNYYEKALSEASYNTFIKPLLLMKS